MLFCQTCEDITIPRRGSYPMGMTLLTLRLLMRFSRCENEDCRRKWSSARAMLVVMVQPHCRIARKRTATGWTATSIEQVRVLTHPIYFLCSMMTFETSIT